MGNHLKLEKKCVSITFCIRAWRRDLNATGTQNEGGHPSYVQPLKNAKEEIFLGEGNTVKNILSPFLNVD